MSTHKRSTEGYLPKESATDVKSWEMPRVMGKRSEALTSSMIPKDLEEAKRFRQQIIENEKKRGFDSGFVVGKEQGLEVGAHELRERAHRFMQFLFSLETGLKGLDHLLEKQMTDLVIAISKAVIRKELSISVESVAHLVQESLKSLPKNAEGVCVHMNPLDIQLLQETDSESQLKNLELIRLLEDESLSRGGCIVEAKTTFIDATIEQRIKDVLDRLQIQSNAEEPKK